MPYINETAKREVRPHTVTNARSAGELNFQITWLMHTYLGQHGESYQVMNDIIGACEGAKAEFQRRVVAPYEDRKILENGDI